MSSASRKRLLLTALAILPVMALAGYQVVTGQGQSLMRSLPQPGTYQVASVDDGDTITVNMAGHHERVRLIGVDAPESHYPGKSPQCGARAATEFVKRLIGSQAVRLGADPLSGNRDRYDRLLRYVYLPDGRLLNAEIVRQGYGFAYVSFPFAKSEQLLNHQLEAKEHERGLWLACRPTLNQHGGYDSKPL